MDLTFSAPIPEPDTFDPGSPEHGESGAAPTPPRRILGRASGSAGGWAADARCSGWAVIEPEAWTPELAESPGLVLVVVDDLSGRELADFLAGRALEDGWILVAPEPDRQNFRLLSASHDYNDYEFRALVEGGEDAPYILDLRRVLKDVSVARHDLNNPLTSALAETQLSLMDEPGGELQESLETIQRQLRRMRDMLKLLSPIRMRR